MEAKTELASEVGTGQDEERVIEMGDASEETKGQYSGWQSEGFGWFIY